MNKATARAHPNIALIKYWGKRDQALFLPATSSFSMTLDGLSATTTVEFSERFSADQVELDGRPIEGKALLRFQMLFDRVRALSGVDCPVRVASTNDFPTAAGLASSAAGGAALAAATSWAAGLDLGAHDLSRFGVSFGRRRFLRMAARRASGWPGQFRGASRPSGALALVADGRRRLLRR